MSNTQLSLFDLLSAPAQVETPAREAQAARPCSLSASHEVSLGSYHVFGTTHHTLDLSAFEPTPHFILSAFPILEYYLSHEYLPQEDAVTVYSHYDDVDYSVLTQKYERMYSVPVRALYEIYRQA